MAWAWIGKWGKSRWLHVTRVVGFGELGAKDDFHTRDMEVRLAQSGLLLSGDEWCGGVGVLPLPKEVQPQRILRPSLQSSSIKYNDESDDDYWISDHNLQKFVSLHKCSHISSSYFSIHLRCSNPEASSRRVFIVSVEYDSTLLCMS